MTTATEPDPLVARFRALSEADQRAILDKHRYWSVDDNWWCETHYEWLEEEANKRGWAVDYKAETWSGTAKARPQIFWSGFWSQGDGACFNGYVQDWDKTLVSVGDWPALQKYHAQGGDMRLGWSSSGRGCHEQSLRFDWDIPFVDLNDLEGLRLYAAKQFETDLEAEWAKLVEATEDGVKDLCCRLYRHLEEDYEYLTSDEQVLESLIANDLLEDEIKEYEDECTEESD